MPRPRSSTFYLPLAPIDANLELKAKLSVLPPSAANALLAPRSTRQPHPYSPCNTPQLPQTKEDECTRLNRVLGIPTAGQTVTPTPVTSGLNVPTNGTGRRRHTDAPKPSFPLTRSRSPLSSASIKTDGNSGATDWSTAAPAASNTFPAAVPAAALPVPALPAIILVLPATQPPDSQSTTEAEHLIGANDGFPDDQLSIIHSVPLTTLYSTEVRTFRIFH